MAEATKTKEKAGERELLGIPADAQPPTVDELRKAMQQAGISVPAKASRAQLLRKLAAADNGPRATVRRVLAEKRGAQAPKASNGKLEMAEMRERIQRKGYREALPKKREELEAVYRLIVEEGILPAAFPAGDTLMEHIDKPYSSLRVPKGRAKTRRMLMSAKAIAGETVAVAAMLEKANRLGQAVGIVGQPVPLPDNTWEAMVELIPSEKTVERLAEAELEVKADKLNAALGSL